MRASDCVCNFESSLSELGRKPGGNRDRRVREPFELSLVVRGNDEDREFGKEGLKGALVHRSFFKGLEIGLLDPNQSDPSHAVQT